MNFRIIQLIIFVLTNYVVADLLRMSRANINESRVLKKITAITITACYIECLKNDECNSTVSEEIADSLPTCHLLKEDDGYNKGGNVMTTIQAIGSKSRVHGGLGCWRDDSPCSVSCAGGTLNQSRACNSPKPEHGGDNCTGPFQRTIKCNEHPCPVHGKWGDWKNISECNLSCGGGMRNQTRDCDSPKPKHGGLECNGSAQRTIKCNEHPCPVHGGWGNWKNISACNLSCGGGMKTQTRDCDSPEPKHGGLDCTGPAQRTIKCNEQPCPPVNGNWGSWRDILACNESCGGGIKAQRRDCDSPKPEHGGEDCAGPAEQTIKCNEQPCIDLKCGSDTSGSAGYMKSPNYPTSYYPNNHYCQSTISGPSNSYINITFIFMVLESSSTCGYDYLKFETTNRYKMYCGQRKEPTTFMSPLTITFKTDGSVRKKGFHFKWERFHVPGR